MNVIVLGILGSCHGYEKYLQIALLDNPLIDRLWPM